MKAIVDKDLCIGCGLCESICPRVFVMDADGKASVKTHPNTPELQEGAQDAEGQCPVSAIQVSKDNPQEG
ncbi:MAG: ferredoxin [Bacillota bacterium]